LGRKPNSVRNYYYMQLREQAGQDLRRAAPFEMFTEEEVHDLLRQVLSARGRGQSVRSCVMDLSHGDRALMLRYQNKYRAILRKRPDLIRKVCEELEQEGAPCPDCLHPSRQEKAVDVIRRELSGAEDADVQAAFRALDALARRVAEGGAHEGDRLRVQRDLLLMQLEDVQLAARDVIGICKEFLGEEADTRRDSLPAFCLMLAEKLSRLESTAG